jgi:hypothetical protein
MLLKHSKMSLSSITHIAQNNAPTGLKNDVLQSDNERLNYYNQRIKNLSLSSSEAVKKYGILTDEYDNILIRSRSLNGDFRQYLVNSKQVKAGKTPVYEYPRTKRFNPSFLAKNKDCPKYLFPKNQNFINWMPRSCKAFKEVQTVESLTIQEGAFKAIQMDKNGFCSVAPNGILNYKLTNDLKEFILTAEPKRVILFYDGDFENAGRSHKKTGVVTDKRQNMFFRSALNMSSSLFDFITKHDLQTLVYFCAVNPNQSAKGYDDLILQEKLKNGGCGVLEVVNAFKSCKDSEYFIFKKLFKTTHEKALSKYLKIDSLERFYSHHIENIKDVFVFKGVKYRKHKNGRLNIIKNDYIKINTTHLVVNKFLSEKEKEIFNVIKSQKLTAIDAPTGVGKTTLLLALVELFKKLGLKAVFALPTQILTKSVYKDAIKNNSDVAILCGGVHVSNDYLDKSLIITTYDKLRGVSDISERVLIVDESHNLVSAFGYRANAVRYFQTAFKTAAKTVLLSGTHNDLMLSVFGFHKIKIKQLEQQKVKVFDYETNDFTSKAMQLLEQRENSNDVDIILMNSNEQLEIFKSLIIKKFNYSNDEVCILNSDTKDSEVYRSIINDKKIKEGVKIVLATQIIAEGISIENKNLGKFIGISTRHQKLSTELIKQASARFRKLLNIDFHLILPLERVLNSSYLTNKLNTFKHEVLKAKAQILEVKSIVSDRKEYLSDVSEYDEFFNNHIENTTFHRTIFETNFNVFEVDKLCILSEILEEQNKHRNNLVLVSELQEYENIVFANVNHAAHADGNFIDEIEAYELKKYIAGQKQIIKSEKERALFIASNMTKDNAQATILIDSVYFAKKGTNRGLKDYIENYFYSNSQIVQSVDSLNFSNENKELLNTNYFNEIVKAYIYFYHVQLLDNDDAKNILNDFDKFNFKVFKSRLTLFSMIAIDNDKKLKKRLSNIEKAELRAKYKFYKNALEVIKDDTIITSRNITKILKGYKAKEAKQALYLFFDFEEKKNAQNIIEYKNFKDLQLTFYKKIAESFGDRKKASLLIVKGFGTPQKKPNH